MKLALDGVGNWGERTKVGERWGQWLQLAVTGQLAGTEAGPSNLFWPGPHGREFRE